MVHVTQKNLHFKVNKTTNQTAGKFKIVPWYLKVQHHLVFDQSLSHLPTEQQTG